MAHITGKETWGGQALPNSSSKTRHLFSPYASICFNIMFVSVKSYSKVEVVVAESAALLKMKWKGVRANS